jgi:hypothetical protein
MIRNLTFIFLFVAAVFTTRAQHETAPPGYYPLGFVGDMWIGNVIAENNMTREVTLSYTKGTQRQTFVGVLEVPRFKMKDGSMHTLKPSDIPLGMRIAVIYMPKWKKDAGKNVKYYSIFRLITPPKD